MVDFSEGTKSPMIIVVSHVNTYQRETSAEKNYNNQVDKDPFYRCQSLSPATSATAQWTQEQGGSGGKDGGYASAQHHRLLLTKANLAMATADYPVNWQQRLTLSSPKWHHFLG